MKDSVKLSPKHGLNPTIPICFWCGEERNEIALLGRINKEDTEAPRSAFLDYEPCDKCKENMAQGVTLMEASHTPNFEGQPAFQRGTYPTGRWLVIKREAANRLFSVEMRNKAFLDSEAYEKVLELASHKE